MSVASFPCVCNNSSTYFLLFISCSSDTTASTSSGIVVVYSRMMLVSLFALVLLLLVLVLVLVESATHRQVFGARFGLAERHLRQPDAHRRSACFAAGRRASDRKVPSRVLSEGRWVIGGGPSVPFNRRGVGAAGLVTDGLQPIERVIVVGEDCADLPRIKSFDQV